MNDNQVNRLTFWLGVAFIVACISTAMQGGMFL